jgi:hypothetical protein
MPSPVAEPQNCNASQTKIVAVQATTTIEGDDGEDHGCQSDTNGNARISITSVRDQNFEYGKRYHKYKAGQMSLSTMNRSRIEKI